VNCMAGAVSTADKQYTYVTSNMASNNSKNNQNKKAQSVAAAPPLNVYKRVAVIRRPSDSLTYEDSEGNPKTVSIQELGDAIATAVSGWALRMRNVSRSYCSYLRTELLL